MKVFKLSLSIIALALMAPGNAWALPVGAPGFSLHHTKQEFSVMGGVGYTRRVVDGEFFDEDLYDTQGSFRFLVRAQYAVMPWLAPSLTLGLGDRTRRLTRFSSELGPLVGLGVRIDPLIQRDTVGLGMAIVIQSSYERSPGQGTYRSPESLAPDAESAERRTSVASVFHGEATLLFSRKDGRLALYGGPKLDYDATSFSERKVFRNNDGVIVESRAETTSPQLPIGLVVGIDYDVTPQVFFTFEMENFHQDSAYLLVGGRW
jgi:hypothetical protein